MKKIYISASVIAALALTVSLTGCKKSVKSVSERKIRVNVQQLEKRTFRQTIPLQGTVKPVEHATISAKISGTLELLKVSEGDRLKTGDILFGIDQQVLKNQVVVKEDEIQVKEAALQSAEFLAKTADINYIQAKRDYDRASSLHKSEAVSLSHFESAETSLKKAEMDVQNAHASIINARAQLKQAQSNLAIAKKNLADSITKAPFDCVVFEKYVEESEYVNAGTNILKLENPDMLEISCFASAVYYAQVVPGITKVEILDPNSGKILGNAVVTYRAPGVDPESRTFELKVTVPKDIKLVSGMLCELNIILLEKEAFGIPVDAALLRANDRYIVFTVNENNRAKSMDITRGIVDKNYCEILNFRELDGKLIVVTGQTFVNNNALLQIINPVKTPAAK